MFNTVSFHAAGFSSILTDKMKIRVRDVK